MVCQVFRENVNVQLINGQGLHLDVVRLSWMNPKELTTPEKRRYPVPNRILPVKDMKSNPDLRLRTVQYAPKHSNSEPSRVFGTMGDTIIRK